MKKITAKEQFCVLLEILDGEDWSPEKIAVVLGCTLRQAQYFCRNDLEIRREKLKKEGERMFFEEEKNAD